ncbi:hydroxymethylglutaryl-CoA lyase [soil metagenome]
MTANNQIAGDARHVHIREVGPRDGFQNEPETIPTADKIHLINLLGRAGFKRIEVASFVRPDVIPQLADGVEVLKAIDLPHDVERMVLIPNSRGLENALKVRDLFEAATLFVSASETHNLKNINRTVRQTMDDVKSMGKTLLAEGLKYEAVIATSFGCPYEGAVPMDRVFDLAEEFAASGATEIGFGDTTGMANPAYVAKFFRRAFERLPGIELTAHFHNTRGQGLANAYSALEAGCTSFESSFGELGGCPVPAGSTGNIATEDLVSMFHEMGIDTGIDLDRVIEAARAAQTVLGRKLTSHSIVAGPIVWEPADESVTCLDERGAATSAH